MADIQTLAFSLDTPESAFQPVCGGRRFKRAFSKADFPLLGDEDSKGTPKEHICLTGRSRQLIPKNLSVSVQTVRSWYMDPKTGRWHWPVNGADEVYPGLFLGDEMIPITAYGTSSPYLFLHAKLLEKDGFLYLDYSMNISQ